MVESENALLTERLEVRHPVEADRPRFVELFGDEAFMAYSDGVMSTVAASLRFDRMLARCCEFTFAKQPIVERSSRVVIGYTRPTRVTFSGSSIRRTAPSTA